MSDIDTSISDRIRDRIQEILVADGVEGHRALTEANSLCDGLGYYQLVRSSTGMRLARGYDGVEVRGAAGDLIESIPFERREELY